MLKFPTSQDALWEDLDEVIKLLKQKKLNALFLGYVDEESTGFAIRAIDHEMTFDTFARLYFASKSVNQILFGTISAEFHKDDEDGE